MKITYQRSASDGVMMVVMEVDDEEEVVAGLRGLSPESWWPEEVR